MAMRGHSGGTNRSRFHKAFTTHSLNERLPSSHIAPHLPTSGPPRPPLPTAQIVLETVTGRPAVHLKRVEILLKLSPEVSEWAMLGRSMLMVAVVMMVVVGHRAVLSSDHHVHSPGSTEPFEAILPLFYNTSIVNTTHLGQDKVQLLTEEIFERVGCEHLAKGVCKVSGYFENSMSPSPNAPNLRFLTIYIKLNRDQSYYIVIHMARYHILYYSGRPEFTR